MLWRDDVTTNPEEQYKLGMRGVLTMVARGHDLMRLPQGGSYLYGGKQSSKA